MQTVPLVTDPRGLAVGMPGRDRAGRVYVGLGNGRYLTVGADNAEAAATGTAPPGVSGVLRAAEGELLGGSTTSHLPEGVNLYFTEARAAAAATEAVHDAELLGWM